MRVVILRALKLGDFLTGVPAYRAVRRAFPESTVTLAAPRELEPLAPELSDANIGINLHGAGPESHRLLIAARARTLFAFRHPDVPQSAGGPPHDPHEHEVRRWCRLLEHYGIGADPADLDLPAPSIAVPRRVRRATLIHPGASSESRRWPVEGWIDVARAEVRAGRRVVITGNASEAGLAHAVAAGAGVPATHVYAGRTSLRELAALVAAAARVVCGDTGVAHLATALRRPSVVLFGPTSPRSWGPPARPYHRVLWSGTTSDPHAPAVDPGLRAISPQRVIDALAALPH